MSFTRYFGAAFQGAMLGPMILLVALASIFGVGLWLSGDFINAFILTGTTAFLLLRPNVLTGGVFLVALIVVIFG